MHIYDEKMKFDHDDHMPYDRSKVAAAGKKEKGSDQQPCGLPRENRWKGPADVSF
jgi:hypothetical protein